MDAWEISELPGGPATEEAPAWSAAAVLARALRDPARRSTPSRQRVFFLRQLRLCGEVGLAAKRTGVPLSTLYRWRARDAKFLARWDDILLQRRQILEDRLMSIIREGEMRSLHVKGVEVGWQRTFSHRVPIRALDYFDRRAAAGIRHSVSHSTTAEPAKSAGKSVA